MPRNGAGVYSLPAGNPVVTATVISTVWANTTLSDLGTALTGSLARNGDGGMTGPFKADNGTVGAPGISWGSETTSGLYRNAAGDFRWAIGGVDVFTVTAAGLSARALIPTASTVPANGMYLPGANNVGIATNTLLRISIASTGAVVIVAPTSGVPLSVTGIAAQNTVTLSLIGTTTGGNAVHITNTGGDGYVGLESSTGGYLITGSTAYALALNTANATPIQFGTNNALRATISSTGVFAYRADGGATDYEVGFRDLPFRAVTSNVAIVATDRGKMLAFAGSTGGQTITVNSTLGTGGICTILNVSSVPVTIAASALSWLSGSGAVLTGSRTLAVGGVITAWFDGVSTNYIWGTGVS
jgi:hypothetical protein